jgi:hypothetical protein
MGYGAAVAQVEGIPVPGAPGRSAFQSAIDAGFTGTEQQWVKVSTTLVGLIYLSPFDGVEYGYLIADGSRLLRALYPKLFAKIGLSFTPDNDGLTFCLPDLRGRLLRFSALGSEIDQSRLLRLDRGDGTVGDAVGTLLNRSIIVTNDDQGGMLTLGDINDIGLIGLIKYL